MKNFIILIFVPWVALADESVIRSTEIHEPVVVHGKRPALFQSEFAAAEGLKEYDVRALHVQRVSCGRRLFAVDGKSLEGDGDIKVTSLGGDLLEAEMPSHLSFDLFAPYNPFRNGVRAIETVSSRQVLSVKDWKDGQPLRLKKQVLVQYENDSKPPAIVQAIDEIKRYLNHPSQFLVRERILLAEPMELYFLCD